ncbi:MAG TPA: PAS domain-containing protein, partial [Spirochaetia bacterium]|nr:PAS domain-containing protein [Spirochaetia bacterium]
MRLVLSPYALAQCASALISLTACLIAWRRRRTPGGLALALMTVAITAWTGSVTLEESAVGLGAKILLAKISYLGVVNVAPLFLLFAWRFGRAVRRTSRWAPLLWVVPAATVAVVATNELHHLVWTSITLSPAGDNRAIFAHGPAWWISIGYSLVLTLLAIARIAITTLRASGIVTRQIALLFVAVGVVWAGVAIYLQPAHPLPGLDLPAASSAIASLLILWGLTRRKTLALKPVARDTLVEVMADGMLVEDARGFIVDANPAAIALLGRGASLVGSPLAAELVRWPELARGMPAAPAGGAVAVIPRGDRFLEAAVAPLSSPLGEYLGRMITLRDVTTRRRAELAAEEKEASLRGLLAAARRQAEELELLDQVRTSLAAELDLPAIIRTVVEGIARVFGYTQVSLYLLRDDFLVLQHQVGYARVIERIPAERGITGRVVRTGAPLLLEDVRDDPDFIGAIAGVVSEICVPLFDRGRAAGVLNVESINGVRMGRQDLRLMTILGEHVNIAFSKSRLYSEARENEERYRALVAALGEGVAIVDLSERFVFANPAAEAVFGVPPEGLVGHSLAEFLSPDELARVVEETGRRRRGESSTYGIVIRRPDGQTRYLELNATPQRTTEGSVIGTLGIFRDVTELRRLQRNLEAERSLLLTLIDTLPDYVYLKDRRSRFILTNRAQAQLFGVPDGRELIGRTDADFVAPELAERYRRADEQVMSTRQPVVNVEEPVQGVGGRHRSVLTTKVPLVDASGEVTGLVGISRDVTDLRLAEEEKAKLQEQLQQSQKMEAVGRLAGGIAHDFNNILTVITGYCEMAIEESHANPALLRNLEEIKRASRRSATLISQLLAFSRRQILLPRVLDLAGLVEGMEGMLRRLLGEDVRLETFRDVEPLLVNADPGRMEQVVMNLAVNARDAMPGGGRLTLRISAVHLGPGDLGGRAEVVPGEFVSLAVSDTGVGMEPETLDRLFEPFFTTKAIGKGTGLGLATVYGIVRQSEGHITCRSTPGRGTTFVVYLPRVADAGPVPAAREEGARPAFIGGRERILLVEDDDGVRRFVEAVLRGAGYSVV